MTPQELHGFIALEKGRVFSPLWRNPDVLDALFEPTSRSWRGLYPEEKVRAGQVTYAVWSVLMSWLQLEASAEEADHFVAVYTLLEM